MTEKEQDEYLQLQLQVQLEILKQLKILNHRQSYASKRLVGVEEAQDILDSVGTSKRLFARPALRGLLGGTRAATAVAREIVRDRPILPRAKKVDSVKSEMRDFMEIKSALSGFVHDPDLQDTLSEMCLPVIEPQVENWSKLNLPV